MHIRFEWRGNFKEVVKIVEWYDKDTAIVLATDGDVYPVAKKEMEIF